MITLVPPAEDIAVPPLILGMGQVDDRIGEAVATDEELVDREFIRIELGLVDAAAVIVLSVVFSNVVATELFLSVVFSHVIGAVLVLSAVLSRVIATVLVISVVCSCVVAAVLVMGVMEVVISVEFQGSVLVPPSVVSCWLDEVEAPHILCRFDKMAKNVSDSHILCNEAILCSVFLAYAPFKKIHVSY